MGDWRGMPGVWLRCTSPCEGGEVCGGGSFDRLRVTGGAPLTPPPTLMPPGGAVLSRTGTFDG